MNKANKLNKKMENLTRNIQLRFPSIIVAIIICGFLFFTNILTVSFMADFYSRSGSSNIKVIFALFLIILLYVMTFIGFVMVLGEASIGNIIVFSSALINLFVSLLPHKLSSSGALIYSDFLLCTFAITDIIICIWIGIHFKPLNNIFVTKEVKRTYKQNGITVEETIKNYPILLPIIIALITAGGAVIGVLIKGK